jgi:hypothetical protein
MTQNIDKLYVDAMEFAYLNVDDSFTTDTDQIVLREEQTTTRFRYKFAELIVRECVQLAQSHSIHDEWFITHALAHWGIKT